MFVCGGYGEEEDDNGKGAEGGGEEEGGGKGREGRDRVVLVKVD